MRWKLGGAGSVAAILILAAGSSGRAEDVFTPLTAVPFSGTTAPAPGTDGKLHLVYELQLTNTRSVPATLKDVAVVDALASNRPSAGLRARILAERGQQQPDRVAEFGPESFGHRLRQLDNQPAANAQLKLGETRLFLVDLALAPRDLPAKLEHILRLTGQGSDATDPDPADLHYRIAALDVVRRLPIIRSPLAGEGWVAFNGCCEPAGAHRATALPVNGRLHFAQRFAIDWMRLDGLGRFRSGRIDDVRSYTSYGEPLLAVADGKVVSVLDGLPDQVPPNLPDPRTINLANVDGNHVVLDLGDGIFAFYAHMKPGSVGVRVGQKVRVGDVLGRLGNSGNSSAPHLHFHLMDGASVLGSEGLPFAYARFKLAGNIPDAAIPEDYSGDFRRFLRPTPQPRKRQFPLDHDVIDFPD